MDSQEIIERLQYNGDQFSIGNRQPFLDFLAEDVVIKLPFPENVPWHGTHVGKDRMAWYLDYVAEALEFDSFEVLNVFGSGDSYAAHIKERIKVKSTGKWLEHEEIFLYRVRDDRIVEYQEFGDTEKFRDAFTA